jgi:hypothetical protein
MPPTWICADGHAYGSEEMIIHDAWIGMRHVLTMTKGPSSSAGLDRITEMSLMLGSVRGLRHLFYIKAFRPVPQLSSPFIG